MKKIIITIIFTVILNSQVVINEIMSSNSTTFYDSYGDTPDWVELYNNGDAGVNLSGYGLSDNMEEPFKWIFPNVTISPDSYLLILASGNDEQLNIQHWETVIDWGDSWNYFVGDQEPPSNWMDTDFSDNSWLSGISGFGYGDGDDNTIVNNVMSIFTRKSFNIETIETIESIVLHIDYDDAFVAYLNGIEIARKNISTTPVGTPPAYFHGADGWREALIYSGGLPEDYQIDLNNVDLVGGENILSIQVHNYDVNSSDMSLIPFLSLGMNQIPDNPTDPPELLNLQVSKIHADFNISASGESIVLTNTSNQTIDLVNETVIPTDVSYGRQPDGSDDFVFFPIPTPGEPNSINGFNQFCDSPEFSYEGGLYENSIQLEITSNTENYPIYYTLDGSEPNLSSSIYNQVINVDETTVLRASIIHSDCFSTNIATNTYLINENSNLPIISLSTDSENFWDNEYGIYVMGSNASPDFPHFGANFWEDWERPVHIEFYETDGTLGFRQDAGVKIFGNWSRGWPQKSLAIFARSEYGTNEINYKIFLDKDIEKFKSIVLRNSGNDWFGNGESTASMFRDGMNTGLMNNTGLDHQAYRPAVVYINGTYWGIHNIREKVNEDFLASNNNGVDPDELDELEGGGEIIEGDNQDYLNMITFVENNNLSQSDNYNYVTELIDIENFIDYYIIQIFIGNTDWPGNNVKFWRSHQEGSKWKWILYDTDFGFGLFPDWSSNVYHNTLQFALQSNGPGWPNPPWSTLLFRKLMENSNFQSKFINHFCFYLNTRFTPEYINNHISNIVENISSEMPNHIEKWNGNINQWNQSVNSIIEFGDIRYENIYNHLFSYFDLSETSNLIVSSYPEEGGKLVTSSQIIPDNPWEATYFNDIPIEITAISNPGYVFSHWAGPGIVYEPTFTFTLSSNINFTAVFLEDSNPPIIVINEFLAVNQSINTDEEGNYEDWIELYYNIPSTINLNGYSLTDDLNYSDKWIFPNIEISGEGHLIIWTDDDDEDGDMHTNFKLSSSGEDIGLFDPNGNLLDGLTYLEQTVDVSYGRASEDSNDWQFFDDPTPGTFNLDNTEPGDINGDGEINVVDIVMVVNMILGISDIENSADFNQDGIVNVVDIVQLLNLILGDANIDATMATILRDGESLNISGNGYIGAIQMTLSHYPNFIINLNKNALVSKYKTDSTTTTLVVVAPESEEIFTTLDSYEIEEVIVTNSREIINITQPYIFRLSQAYPNPFNPITNIDFSIPNNLFVSIKVYDLKGRNIVTLTEQNYSAGNYTVTWNAELYSSGLYFVKMFSSDFSQTQKIMLVK